MGIPNTHHINRWLKKYYNTAMLRLKCETSQLLEPSFAFFEKYDEEEDDEYDEYDEAFMIQG